MCCCAAFTKWSTVSCLSALYACLHALSVLHQPTHPQASDEFSSLLVMTLKHKLRSFAFSPTPPKSTKGQLALGLTNNSVEVGTHQAELCWIDDLQIAKGQQIFVGAMLREGNIVVMSAHGITVWY